MLAQIDAVRSGYYGVNGLVSNLQPHVTADIFKASEWATLQSGQATCALMAMWAAHCSGSSPSPWKPCGIRHNLATTLDPRSGSGQPGSLQHSHAHRSGSRYNCAGPERPFGCSWPAPRPLDAGST